MSNSISLESPAVHKGDSIVPLSRIYSTYDWVYDDGYNNFQNWVEAAARTAGK
jgi:hypothetical protein